MYGTDYENAGFEEFCINLSAEKREPGFSLEDNFYKLSTTSANGETLSFDYYPPVRSFEVDEILAGVARANSQFALSVARSTADEIRALGERLYDSIWHSRITELYQSSSGLAKEQRKNLRLRVVLDHPSLAALPWEFLFDPRRKDFLSLSTRTPLARQWSWETAMPESSPFVKPPLRVLVVEAEVRPWDQGARLEISNLKRFHESNHGMLDLVDVVYDATPTSFINALTSSRPYHILHLCLSAATPEVVPNLGSTLFYQNNAPMPLPDSLVLMDNKTGSNLNPDKVDLPTLLVAIGMHPDLKLVYLSGDCTDWLACQLTKVSPATIGWRGLNTSEAYISFQEGFYTALLRGLPLESAVTYGRKAIDSQYPGGKEWGMPVFYLQTPNGFTLSRQQSDSHEAVQPAATAESVSDGPSNPANLREWTKLWVQLSVAEENLRAVTDQLRKYVADEVPPYLNNQSQELQNAISNLKANLKQL